MYLQAVISQMEMVREKFVMGNSKLKIVLSSDTFQLSTLYLTQLHYNYFF